MNKIRQLLLSTVFDISFIMLAALILVGVIYSFTLWVSIVVALLGAWVVGYVAWFFVSKPGSVASSRRVAYIAAVAFWVLVICLLLPHIPAWILWLFAIIVFASVASALFENRR